VNSAPGHSTSASVTVSTAADGTLKYRFSSERGLGAEAAHFFVPDRDIPHIACVSTQLGCAVACQFCSTAPTGFDRNLTAEEIALQVSTIVDNAAACGVSHADFEVSFMGMGEPLANANNVLLALDRIHRRYPLMTRAALSTVGPGRRIVALADERGPDRLPIHLQISLHATTDRLRHALIPNAADGIQSLLAAGRYYHLKTSDRVCLNYILFDGVNDSPEDASWFDSLDRDAFSVRLTVLNDVPNMPRHLRAASGSSFIAFSNRLTELRVPHKIFRGDGLDVRASCGQLVARPVEITARELHD